LNQKKKERKEKEEISTSPGTNKQKNKAKLSSDNNILCKILIISGVSMIPFSDIYQSSNMFVSMFVI
jgi:hypothetical protein